MDIRAVALSLLASLSSSISLGCAGLAGLDDFSDPLTDGADGSGGGGGEGLTEGGTAGMVSEGGAGGADGEGGFGGDASSGCEQETFEVFVEADTVLFPGECNGANYAGGMSHANLGLGVGLFRFALPPEVTSAIQEDRVVELTVVLARDFDCVGEGVACPAAAGKLAARPLRNDWEEGPASFTPYMGADWCRRGAGAQSAELWHQAGASGSDDTQALSGSALVDAVQSIVEIDLEPTSHLARVDASAGFWALSVRIEAEAGAVFVTGSHEDFEPAEPPARLRGVYCVE